MIQERTVLVLGAGASVPYEFPSGEGLKGKIEENLSQTDNRHVIELINAGFSEDEIKDFHVCLKEGIHETIDEYLNNNRDVRSLGLAAIAYAIKEFENHDKLFPPHDWYKLLFKSYQFDAPSAMFPIMGIITFNYDRSLEYFLRTCIERSFGGREKEKAIEKLEQIEIIHVHGDLGSLDEMPYAMNMNNTQLKRIEDRLGLIFDDLYNSEPYDDARNLIMDADNVVFLGFGYDLNNLRRLNVNGYKRPEFFGTGYDLPGSIRGETRNFFEKEIDIYHPDTKINEYLQKDNTFGHMRDY